MSGAVGGKLPPAVNATGDQDHEKHKSGDGEGPERQARNPGLRNGQGRRGSLLDASEIVFGEQGLFVEAEITRDRADESMAEDAPGQLVPILIFERGEIAAGDARGLADFFEGDLAQFALALQSFAESAFGHERGTFAEAGWEPSRGL